MKRTQVVKRNRENILWSSSRLSRPFGSVHERDGYTVCECKCRVQQEGLSRGGGDRNLGVLARHGINHSSFVRSSAKVNNVDSNLTSCTTPYLQPRVLLAVCSQREIPYDPSVHLYACSARLTSPRPSAQLRSRTPQPPPPFTGNSPCPQLQPPRLLDLPCLNGSSRLLRSNNPS